MSVLTQYLLRKGYDSSAIKRVRENGSIVVPPDWLNYFVEDELMFSHRCNRYAKPYGAEHELHVHGYYELLVHIGGEAEYIENDQHIYPKPNTVMWCRPGCMHAHRVSACEYERYLFYFAPQFFSQEGKTDGSILKFMEKRDTFALAIDETRAQGLKVLLERIEQTLGSDIPYKNLLTKALIIELFAFLNNEDFALYESQHLNDPIADIKRYIDRHYAEISGITMLAEEFHYSREHLSRKFKSRFSTSISEYLSRRRVIESIRLLEERSITESCYAVGFRNLSVYIAAFKKNMGCLPSEYKKQRMRSEETSC